VPPERSGAAVVVPDNSLGVNLGVETSSIALPLNPSKAAGMGGGPIIAEAAPIDMRDIGFGAGSEAPPFPGAVNASKLAGMGGGAIIAEAAPIDMRDS